LYDFVLIFVDVFWAVAPFKEAQRGTARRRKVRNWIVSPGSLCGLRLASGY
jgi:hypothetical protein